VGVFSQALRIFTHDGMPRPFDATANAPILNRHVCCYVTRRDYLAQEQRLVARNLAEGELEDDTMAKDDRDTLEILKQELSFIEEGGYGRSVRAPWLPKSIFQDSLSCLNYGYPYRAHPCAECRLLDFVGPEDRSQPVPCHFIPLNETGNTIEELEMEGNESKMQNVVKSWLEGKISQLEAGTSKDFSPDVD
jgi:hypothetical protein